MQALMVSFKLLDSKGTPLRPLPTVVGQLPHHKLKVIRHDRTTQSLLRIGGDSLDAM